MRQPSTAKRRRTASTAPRPRDPVLAQALVLLTLLWFLIAALSLVYHFLDPIAIGTEHHHQGVDFFAVPGGFQLLAAGNNLYLTEYQNFGPYASWYPYHPVLALAVGSWTSLLPPWQAYGAFVVISIILVLLGAHLLAREFEGRTLKAFTYFAAVCTPSAYLMFWNGQMHVFVVLAVFLVIAGLVRLHRHGDDAGGAFWVGLGLAISLLSKPVLLLAVPALLAYRPTRRAVVVALAAWAAVSLVLLLTPRLNPGGYNGIHWVNILTASSTQRPIQGGVTPVHFTVSDGREIFSLPAMVYRATNREWTWAWRCITAITVLCGAGPLLMAGGRDKTRSALVAFMAAALCSYLAYFVVWEYHYSAVMPILPALLYLRGSERDNRRRVILTICFIPLLLMFVPTVFIVSQAQSETLMAMARLQRIVPVAICFSGLIVYQVMLLRSRTNPVESALQATEAGRHFAAEIREVFRAAALASALVGVTVFTAFATTPLRMKNDVDNWTVADRIAQFEDVLSRPGGFPESRSNLHHALGFLYLETDAPKALLHDRSAASETGWEPSLLYAQGEALRRIGDTNGAAQSYRAAMIYPRRSDYDRWKRQALGRLGELFPAAKP